jgi:hypothetical protein
MGHIATVEASSRRGAPLKLATTPDGETLIVAVAGKDDGKTSILALEAVLQTDVTSARDETWWIGVRTGRLPPDLNSLSMKLLPGRRQQRYLVDGYTLELGDATHSFSQRFSVQSLTETAQRALARLIQKKQFNEDAKVHYFLICQKVTQQAGPKESVAHDPQQDVRVRAVTCHEPLPLEEASLDEYLELSEPMAEAQAAEPVGQDTVLHMPVFFQSDVWAKGHQFARRGNDLESAGIWTGRLIRDSKTPEVFLVVDACIDAQHADEERYSVTFSGATWSRVRHVLQQRRHRLNRPNEIILGSVHGHNFTPGTQEDGDRLCDECPHLPTCRKTTAVLSTDDLAWHRSVFAAQPYAILALWGWTARQEEVWQCYSLAGATLISRPIRMLKAEPSR